jgi:hypothetical protein
MSADRTSAEAVAERWIEHTLASYPAGAVHGLLGERDPFRNPAGHAIREGLTALARELLGGMDEKAMAPALDAVVRLRAVQGFRPSEALGFVFDLRAIMAETAGAETAAQIPPDLGSRIDRLALMAFDRYMACREQIAGLREEELRKRLQYAAASRIEP